MVLEEIYTLSKHGGNLGSTKEIAELPVYKRRFFLNKMAMDAKRDAEERDKARQQSSSSVKRRRLW